MLVVVMFGLLSKLSVFGFTISKFDVKNLPLLSVLI